VLKRLQDAGVDPTPGGTPEKLADFIKAELAKWAPIIQASGAQTKRINEETMKTTIARHRSRRRIARRRPALRRT
jgi:hypothetical protein